MNLTDKQKAKLKKLKEELGSILTTAEILELVTGETTEKEPPKKKTKEVIIEDLDEELSEDDEAEEVSTPENYWDDLDFSDDFNPFLKQKNGIVYTLKLVDPTNPPRTHKDTNYGGTQKLWDCELLDIKPESAWDDEDSDEKKLFVKGRAYSVAMRKRASKRFKEYAISQDYKVEVFTYERTGTGFGTDYKFGNSKLK